MAHPGGRPLKFSSPQEILDKGLAYFQEMEEQKRPRTITGLCIALGTFRDVLMTYEDDRGPEFSNAVKSLKLWCENYAEEQVFVGKNAAGAIFALKNYGWRDKSEQELYGKDGKDLMPQPIDDVSKNNRISKNQIALPAHTGNTRGDLSEQDGVDPALLDSPGAV